MQRGVAAAMQYLSSFAFVHRALSAHSVLVNSHLVCKVARLGRSPQVRAQPRRLRLLQRALEAELGPGCPPPLACHGICRSGTRLCAIQEGTLGRHPGSTRVTAAAVIAIVASHPPPRPGPRLYASLGGPRGHCTRKTYDFQRRLELWDSDVGSDELRRAALLGHE